MFEVNAIDTHPVPDMPPQLYYTIDWARCPLCGAENYFLEIDAVSDAPGGRQFLNDNCWEAAPAKYFSARTDTHEWRIAHHTNVREVSFEALPGDPGAFVTSVVWLDIHYFPPFAAMVLNEAENRVRAIARAVQPAIEAMRWRT